jgi:TatD DNase family protein
LREWLERFPHAGVGEIGLDRWKPGLDFAPQPDLFRRQLELAAELDRPVSIHCLRAWGMLFELLRDGPRPARGFLLHSYGGPLEMVAPLTELGAYFSLPGAFARERKTRQRAVFQAVPAERLLIETDAPDQMPPAALVRHPCTDPATGRKLNHPANLGAVYEFAAELREQPLSRLAAQVEANFHRLFS